MRRTVCYLTATFVSGFLLVAVPASYAADLGVACRANKLKEAGKYANCRMKAESKAVKKGEAPDYTKCDEKFAQKWTTAETKGAGMCLSEGDGLFVGLAIQECLGEISAGLAGGTPLGGSFWFLGEIDQSCDEVCAAKGLTYDSATASFAGANSDGGTLGNCDALINSLPLPPVGPCDTNYNTTALDFNLGVGVGCFWSPSDVNTCDGEPPIYNWFPFRDHLEPTTSAAKNFGAARICACQ